AIRIGNLQQLAALPARAVWVLGLDREPGSRDRWDLSQAPGEGDQIRYSLLQGLLAAREAAHFSFVGSFDMPPRTIVELLEGLETIADVRTVHPRHGLRAVEPARAAVALRSTPSEEIRVSRLTAMVHHPLRAYLRDGVGAARHQQKRLIELPE